MGAKERTNVNKIDDELDYLGKEWDVAKLRRVFHDSDVQDIQQIPIAGIGREDYPAWNHTKKWRLLGLVHLSLVHGFEEDESGQPGKLVVGC